MLLHLPRMEGTDLWWWRRHPHWSSAWPSSSMVAALYRSSRTLICGVQSWTMCSSSRCHASCSQFRQHLAQLRQLLLGSFYDAVLLPAVQLRPQPGHRHQSHPQVKIGGKLRPSLLLRLSTTHDRQSGTGVSGDGACLLLLVDG
ncbi:hypothetical protein [Streptomyces halstedii]|uniref:Uncharacterized protein n=1 Tax=Streptomyces halstedii TaxID=1944 RepID=A0A6N9U6M3_STRHA|nr:hypothetical protein [Streptomyces halstedii]NEA19501.1 hypothetical protein [Streptomyces halstedii]